MTKDPILPVPVPAAPMPLAGKSLQSPVDNKGGADSAAGDPKVTNPLYLEEAADAAASAAANDDAENADAANAPPSTQFVAPKPMAQQAPNAAGKDSSNPLLVSLQITPTNDAAKVQSGIVAPLLAKQLQGFDGMIAQANVSIGKAQELFAQTIKEALKFNSDYKKIIAGDIFTQAKAAADAASTKKKFTPAEMGLKWLSNIAQLIGQALSVLVAVAASALTCGASVALVVIAAVGLAQSVVQMIGEGVADAGGPDVGPLTLGRGIAEVYCKMGDAVDPGHMSDPAYRDTVKMALTMVFDLVIAGVSAAATGGAGAVAKKVADMSKSLSEVVTAGLRIAVQATSHVLETVGNLSNIAHAGISFHMTSLQVEADNYTAHKSFSEGLEQTLQTLTDQLMRSLQSAVEAYLKTIESSSEMLEQSASNNLAVASSIKQMG